MTALGIPAPLRTITISGMDYPIEPFLLENNSGTEEEKKLNPQYLGIVSNWISNGTPKPEPKCLQEAYKRNILSISDTTIINALCLRTKTSESQGVKNKFIEYSLKKFLHGCLYDSLRVSPLSVRSVGITAADFEFISQNLVEQIQGKQEEILAYVAERFRPIVMGIQTIPSACGNYLFKIATKNRLVIGYYLTLCVAGKICRSLDYERFVIPPSIVLNLKKDNKSFIVLMQQKLNINYDIDFQSRCRQNADHSLDIALEQFLTINQIIGIASKGVLNRTTYVIRNPSDEHATIALSDFEPNDLHENLQEHRAIVQWKYSDRLLYAFTDYYNSNTEAVFRRVINKNILPSVINAQLEEKSILRDRDERRAIKALAFYNDRGIKDSQLIEISPSRLSEEMAKPIHFIEITEIDIDTLLKQINTTIIEQNLKPSRGIIDKRLIILNPGSKLYHKAGMILVKLWEKNLIAAVYPHGSGYEVYT